MMSTFRNDATSQSASTPPSSSSSSSSSSLSSSSASSSLGVARLACPTKQYAWGVLGKENSKVAQFASTTPGSEHVEADTPYAELWMGAHPSGPSFILNDTAESSSGFDERKPLASILNQETLGSKIHHTYGDELPFLFKVLSIRKALSIQAHPDKALARKLHAERPDVYKDPNHKPEIAVALTDFEALCGFRPLEETVAHLSVYPEFRAVAGEEAATTLERAVASTSCDAVQLKSALKNLFASLMKKDPEFVARQVDALVGRLRTEQTEPTETIGDLNALILRLAEQYPGDVGIFCALMFNYIVLKPGQAMFLCANEPHAYLSGDCVECMAASDNVVRAGLTPKFKDVDVLIDMLTYTSSPPQKRIMKPAPLVDSSRSILYDPPIDEFTIMRTEFTEGDDASETVPPLDGASILIVTEGGVSMSVGKTEDEEKVQADVLQGHVYFVPAGLSVVMKPLPEASRAVVYRAYSAV